MAGTNGGRDIFFLGTSKFETLTFCVRTGPEILAKEWMGVVRRKGGMVHLVWE